MISDSYLGLQYLAWVLYLAIFVRVVARAVQLPTRAHTDMALFWGAMAWLSMVGAVLAALNLQPPTWLGAVDIVLLLALPYLLLRLVADFTELPPLLLRGVEIGLGLLALAILVVSPDLATGAPPALVAAFVVLLVYDTVAFCGAARRSRGVTRRRFAAIALGSVCLSLAILAAGLEMALPGLSRGWLLIERLASLAAAVAYFVGFAPPTWLRRAWQEPELRAFLARSAPLVREPDTRRVLHELEDAAANAFGATAAVGLWLGHQGVLRFFPRQTRRREPGSVLGDSESFDVQPGRMIAGQAFAAQQAQSTMDSAREDPEHAAYYRALGSQAVMAAPITAGDRRLGVLVVYAQRAPVFAQSDLELVQLLADQAAVVLENRLLVEEAARARAREEADRQKDEFLDAISHDLRNPLTAIQGVAQLLERRLERDGRVDPDRLAAALANIRGSTAQMANLIDQLLDYARLRMDRPLELNRGSTDLVALAREAVAAYASSSELHELRLEASVPAVVGYWDAARLERAVQNLVSNALKYSPDGGEVVVRVSVEQADGGTWAVLAVQDQGMGIPDADLPHLFERFHRGANVAGRIPGTGIGLAAAAQIVQQHGGRISVTSEEGSGSTFTVRLPLPESTSPHEPGPPPDEGAAADLAPEPHAPAGRLRPGLNPAS